MTVFFARRGVQETGRGAARGRARGARVEKWRGEGCCLAGGLACGWLALASSHWLPLTLTVWLASLSVVTIVGADELDGVVCQALIEAVGLV